MSDMEILQARCDELESHIAHQDSTLEDLSDTVGRQWETIDALRREVEILKDRLAAMEGDVTASLPDEGPPPHY